jgi:type III restriction enzyme
LQTEYKKECGVRFGQIPREPFASITMKREGKPGILGQEDSQRLWEHLRAKGYVDGEGRIQGLYDPKNPAFVLDVPPDLKEHSPQILDAMNRFVFENRIVDARKRQQVKVCIQVLLDPEFEALWNKVSQRTRYRVSFDTEELIRLAATRIKAAPKIFPLTISVEKRSLNINRAGVFADNAASYESGFEVERNERLPDILAYLQNETELTRHTIARILIESGRAEDMRINPQAFITLTAREITLVLHEMMLKGIEYEKIAGVQWEMRLLEDEAEEALTRYLDNLYRVKNTEKTTFDFVEYQSKVEEAFAQSLDTNEAVKFFVKLPSWFRIDTPLGPYNPDWAVLLEGASTKLYLVRETKGTNEITELRNLEAKKIHCGHKHFDALGVDFEVTISLSDTLKKLRANEKRPFSIQL